jgi:arylsulfatase A-like enzyme
MGEVGYFTKERGGVIDWQRNGHFLKEKGYFTDLIGDEAVKLIESHDPRKPFFLYFASLAPHAPYQAPKADIDKYSSIGDANRRSYAAMIDALDVQIGHIVEALDRKKLRENTIILFSSDNSGPTKGLFATGARSEEERTHQEGGLSMSAKPPPSNAPFRGGKGELHEGGVRVVAFANWPGELKPRVIEAPLHMVDVMPTLLALAGAKGDPAHPLDGRDMWKTISEGGASPNEDILINVEAFRGAVRKGDWKLVKVALLPGKTELFNLRVDPGEKNNVAEANPDVVRDLEMRLDDYAKQQKMSEWLKAQPAFLGAQGKSILDPDYDVDDDGLPHERAALPMR